MRASWRYGVSGTGRWRTFERSLRDARSRLAEAKALGRMGLFEFDLRTGTFWADDDWWALLGTTAAAVGGPRLPVTEGIRRFLRPEQAEDLTRDLHALVAAQDQSAPLYSLRAYRGPDGREIWLRSVYRAERDRAGRVLRVRGVSKDFTERQRVADDLERAETFLQAVVEALPVAVIAKEPRDFRFIVWNRAAERTFGLTAEQVLGRTDFDLFPEEQAAFFRQKDLEVMQLGRALEIPEEPADVASGQHRWLRTRKDVVHGAEGQPRAILVLCEDITETRIAEEALRESRAWAELLARVVRETAAGVLLSDRQGLIRWVNPAFCEMSGFAPEELVGRSATWLFEQSGTAPDASAEIARQVAENGVYEGELRKTYRGGGEYWVRLAIQVLRDEAGEPTGYMSIQTDISESKRAEVELRAAHDALHAALRRQQDLVHMVVHDMRSPLAAIHAYSELFALTADAQTTEDLDVLKGATQRLLRMVDEMLFIARNEAGELRLRRRPTDVRQLLERAAGLHRAGNTVRLSVLLGSDSWNVEADSDVLQRVIDNLVQNAVKFSPRGGAVELDAIRDGDRTLLRVKDQGPGVPPEHRLAIFDKFAIVDLRRARVQQIGLGLAFCKMAVEAHGGSIRVLDNTPRGSVFVVELPHAAREGDSQEPSEARGLAVAR